MRLKAPLATILLALVFEANAGAPCDLSLMKYVHNPSRLKVVEGCVTVRGVVTKKLPLNPWDGDYHVNIKPDPEFEHLLNDSNRKDKKGSLVVEFVCQGWFTLKKEGRQVCVGYNNRLPLPKKGDYVEITGIHVLDAKEGWMEIHPASNIVVLRKRGARK